MQEFQTFTFDTFSFDPETYVGRFYYSFDKWLEAFEEVIEFGAPWFEKNLEGVTLPVLNNFLFQVHLALGISYYKLFPTVNLEVRSGYLEDDQLEFWEKFYKNGLWEFFITNEIDPEGLVKFKNAGATVDMENMQMNRNYLLSSKNFVNKKSLLLWWGGKDSIVSNSILDLHWWSEWINTDVDLFVFWKKDSIKQKTADISWKKIFFVKRHISNKIFTLNKEGYFNWHVPITWIIAFIAAFSSYLYGYSNIILSNERSSSEANTEWKWMNINHQYSKSFEFELDVHKYLQRYVSQGILYFSLLRWMYEYKIAELFSTQDQYFTTFSSCNKNFRIHKDTNIWNQSLWCWECEKCVFVFLLLSGPLWLEKVIEIFWKNVLDDESLSQILLQIIGKWDHKPFECVGTYEESLYAAKMLILKEKNNLPKILEKHKDTIEKACDFEKQKVLKNKLSKIYNDHIIPEKFTQFL